jgi:drug/metabolite transporter (DMT)-like permease
MLAGTQSKPHATDWLLVAAPGIIWGASFLFIAEGLRSVAPNGVTFLRILIGFVTLSIFPGARKGIGRRAWIRTTLLGTIWFAFPLSMFPIAEQHVSSALTGMLNAATPIFVAMVAAGIVRSMPSARVTIGLLTGVAGSVLIALPSFGEGSSSAFGVMLIILACASYGFALNLARPLQQEFGALPVIWRGLGVAAVLTAPLGLRDMAGAHWQLSSTLSLLALGAFGTGVAFVLVGTAAGRVGATRASGAAFLIPPVALLLGVLVRHEHVAWLSVVGAAVCVLGAWMIRPKQVAAQVVAKSAEEVRCVPVAARG